jgi:hypothetical protein
MGCQIMNVLINRGVVKHLDAHEYKPCISHSRLLVYISGDCRAYI